MFTCVLFAGSFLAFCLFIFGHCYLVVLFCSVLVLFVTLLHAGSLDRLFLHRRHYLVVIHCSSALLLWLMPGIHTCLSPLPLFIECTGFCIFPFSGSWNRILLPGCCLRWLACFPIFCFTPWVPSISVILETLYVVVVPNLRFNLAAMLGVGWKWWLLEHANFNMYSHVVCIRILSATRPSRMS